MELSAELVSRIDAAGERAVLRFWDRLDDAARRGFAAQLASVDWSGLPGLRAAIAGRDAPSAGLPDLDAARTPPAIPIGLANPRGDDPATVARGADALRAGRVGAILVAGGQGSRLGHDGPKGIYRVGPVSRASLFELLLGKLVAVGRRYGRDVPLAIMTSTSTVAGTRDFLAAHGCCGLDASRVFVFQQEDLPALDAAGGHLLLDQPGRLALAPDGHGGLVKALRDSGGLDWFGRQGIEHVVTFQVDNPLALPLQPAFLGAHLATAAEFTTQVVRKREPGERVGVVVEEGGGCRIVEYSDLPAAAAAERLPDGRLRFDAGSIAVHAFSVAFLRRTSDDPRSLPLHLAFKAVPHVDGQGTRVVPAAPNAYKFERFIFDLMPLARGVCLVEVAAEEAFAPLKNPPGAASDAPEHVQAALVRQARRIVEATGRRVADDAVVELATDSIIDAADVDRALPPGVELAGPTLVRLPS